MSRETWLGRTWATKAGLYTILAVGSAITPLLVADGWFEQVCIPEDADALLPAFLEARDMHSYGPGPDGLDLEGLTEEELERRYRAHVGSPEATVALDRTLAELLGALGEAFGPALVRALDRGTRRIVLLARHLSRHVPWFGVPVGDATLGETFALTTVETLAPVPRQRPRPNHAALYVGGAAAPGSPLALGKAMLAPLSSEVVGPLARDDFEKLAARAGVLVVFAHGTSTLLHSEATGLDLDEDDRIGVNRFSVSEARTLDLRGVRRVELWACESGRGDAAFGHLRFHDEPTGMDASLLLAGAECVISSLWMQYVLSAAMIAEAFTLEMAGRRQMEAEALGTVVTRYRRAVADGGVFAGAVERHLGQAEVVSVDAALRAGLDAWRDQVWSDTLGRTAPPLAGDLVVGGHRLGPAPHDAKADLHHILATYRSPLAWAGWRVTARSKEAIELPAPGAA